MSATEAPHLRTHDDPQVAHLRWIVLDRPDARNAWSDEMLSLIHI